jgi:hypothetical protein
MKGYNYLGTYNNHQHPYSRLINTLLTGSPVIRSANEINNQVHPIITGFVRRLLPLLTERLTNNQLKKHAERINKHFKNSNKVFKYLDVHQARAGYKDVIDKHLSNIIDTGLFVPNKDLIESLRDAGYKYNRDESVTDKDKDPDKKDTVNSLILEDLMPIVHKIDPYHMGHHNLRLDIKKYYSYEPKHRMY